MLTMADGDIIFRRDGFGADSSGQPQVSRLTGILPDED
jgi:hypothetical protein